MDRLSAEIEETKEQVGAREKAFAIDTQRLREEIERLKDEQRRISVERERLVQQSKEKERELSKQLDECRNEIKRLEERGEAFVGHIHELAEIREELEETLRQEREKMNTLEFEAKEHKESLKQVMDTLSTTFGIPFEPDFKNTLLQVQQNHSVKVESLQRTISEYEARIERLDRELAALDDSSEIKKLEIINEELNLRLKERQVLIQDLERAIAGKENQLTECKDKLALLQHEKIEINKVIDGLFVRFGVNKSGADALALIDVRWSF